MIKTCGEESPGSTGKMPDNNRADNGRCNLLHIPCWTDSATENKPPVRVRVKRWCKRPPYNLVTDVAGKPHLEQDRIEVGFRAVYFG